MNELINRLADIELAIRVKEASMSRATPEEIAQYVSGFNKTKLKAWMVVHPLPDDVVELVSKTSVSLEVN